MTQPPAHPRIYHITNVDNLPSILGAGGLRSDSAMLGAIIVAFHNVWTGIPAVLTILGWGQILKALLSFTVPSIGMRGLQRVSAERSHEFVVAGVVALALGALLWYHILTH